MIIILDIGEGPLNLTLISLINDKKNNTLIKNELEEPADTNRHRHRLDRWWE